MFYGQLRQDVCTKKKNLIKGVILLKARKH